MVLEIFTGIWHPLYKLRAYFVSRYVCALVSKLMTHITERTVETKCIEALNRNWKALADKNDPREASLVARGSRWPTADMAVECWLGLWDFRSQKQRGSIDERREFPRICLLFVPLQLRSAAETILDRAISYLENKYSYIQENVMPTYRMQQQLRRWQHQRLSVPPRYYIYIYIYIYIYVQ